MKTTSVYLLLFIRVFSISLAQQQITWPIEKVNVTGNYGEIRPNHFHAGLDFSTEGLENLPIRAVKDGYVSRIKISAFGYGKVIYITHPDGKLTVYAHQNRFNDTIERFVRWEQYNQKTFELELFPDKNQFPVKEGVVIGYSGNTGGSTGPHLHFELRDELTEIPINPLLYFKLSDTVKPLVSAVGLYDVNDTLETKFLKSIKVKGKCDSLFCVIDTVILRNSSLGIAFCGEDREVFEGNPNNIYDVKLFCDTSLIYHHQLNYISFDQAHYVNEFCDMIEKQKFQKCFTSKVYPAEIYKTLVNSGKIELKDTLFHLLKMEFTDEAGNKSAFEFYVRTRKFSIARNYKKTKMYVNCQSNYNFQTKSCDINLIPKTFYNDAIIKITDELAVFNSLSITPENINFRWPGTIKIKLPNKLQAFPAKVLLVTDGSVSIPIKTDMVNEYHLKKFGTFRLVIDSIGPDLKTKTPVKKLKTLIKKADHITFVMTDNLSGINKYDLLINDRWVLAEYDGKTDLLTYSFDIETPLEELKIVLKVSDKVGNESVFKLNLNR